MCKVILNPNEVIIFTQKLFKSGFRTLDAFDALLTASCDLSIPHRYVIPVVIFMDTTKNKVKVLITARKIINCEI